MYGKKEPIQYREVYLEGRDIAISEIQTALIALEEASNIYNQFRDELKHDAIKHAALSAAKERYKLAKDKLYYAIEHMKTIDHSGVIEKIKQEQNIVTKADENKELIDRLLQTIQKVTDERNDLLRERDGEVWIWQGDDDDHLESLACPILIRPEQLRDIIGETNKEKPISNCDDLVSQSGDYPGGHSDD